MTEDLKLQNKKIYRLALSNCPEFNQDVDSGDYFQFKLNGQKRQFIHLSKQDKILEIRMSQEKDKKTVILGNYVQTGSDYMLINQVDPLFLTLEYLIKARGKVDSESQGKKQDFDLVFNANQTEDENEQKIVNILKESERVKRSIKNICSVQCIGDDMFIRLEDDLLNKWLDNKINKASDAFQAQFDCFMPQSIVQKKEGDLEDSMYLSLGVVYEYLPSSMFLKVLNRHNLTEKQFMDFQKNQKQSQGPNQGIDNVDQIGDITQNNKNNQRQQKKTTTKDEKDKQAAKGTKSIMSFFQKK